MTILQFYTDNCIAPRPPDMLDMQLPSTMSESPAPGLVPLVRVISSDYAANTVNALTNTCQSPDLHRMLSVAGRQILVLFQTCFHFLSLYLNTFVLFLHVVLLLLYQYGYVSIIVLKCKLVININGKLKNYTSYPRGESVSQSSDQLVLV